MPEIEVRPGLSTDLNELMGIDHSCASSYVWQMERLINEGQISILFREIRLPRSIIVNYPHQIEICLEDWKKANSVLVASQGNKPVGYVHIEVDNEAQSGWIKDLAVAEKYRRQGIGSALVLAAQDWSAIRNLKRVILEMSSKNLPAIRLAQKLGFDFSGYNDSFYANKDIALFFSRLLK